MTDGAHLGITPSRALGTILGGQEQPGAKEREDLAQVEARVRQAPLPEDPKAGIYYDYDLMVYSLAHAFLLIAEDDPGILNRQLFYPTDCEHEILRGKPRDLTSAIWEEFKRRYPAGNNWLEGATGFQVGFAFNVVRSLKQQGPANNPAIATLDLGDGE